MLYIYVRYYLLLDNQLDKQIDRQLDKQKDELIDREIDKQIVMCSKFDLGAKIINI